MKSVMIAAFAASGLFAMGAPQPASRGAAARAPIEAFFKRSTRVDVVFSRYKADGTKYATYQSLWIVTKKDDGWGVQARSSFAP
jgi:hypothetical protein